MKLVLDLNLAASLGTRFFDQVGYRSCLLRA